MRSSGTDPARRRLLAWAISAALGGFVFGYELAVISGALLFLRSDFELTALEQGALVSVVPLGAMLGGLQAGRVADALGRRRALILIAATFVVGTALAVIASSYTVLLAARALTGLAVGAASSTVPLYLSEIAPPDLRGRLVTLNQLAITLGIVAAYGAGLAFSAAENWRAMFALGLVPSLALLAGMLRAPETPTWLEAHGETGRAREVLLQVVNATEAERLLDELRRGRGQRFEPAGLSELLHSRAVWALLIGVTLGLIQQFAGVNAVIAYAPSIMENTGLDASNSILFSLAVGVANVVATSFAVRMVDRRGRRPLLLASAAGAFASLLVLGLTFEVSLGGWTRWLSLAGLLAYIVSFALGLGPIFWLLIAEIFPLEARAAGVAIATAVNWFSSFLVGLMFAPLVDAIGQGPTFWVFAGVCALGFAFVARFVPETKGRTLGEIEAEVTARFGRNAPGQDTRAATSR
jgi:sugar porter (SP) family MFS transporter